MQPVDTAPARMLLLPGWMNSDADHWQSHWERRHGCLRVQQDDWVWPKRGDWMSRLETVVLECPAPVVLIAHSLGCHLVGAWAAHTRHADRVRAAFLVAAPDLGRADLPPNLSTWRRDVRAGPLPFRGLSLYSCDDPFCSPTVSLEMARAWGVRAHALGALGHVNSRSALGDWAPGWALLQTLWA